MRLPSLAAALLLSAGLVACAPDAIERPPVIGQAAPDFTAATLDGDSLSLADLRGSVVLVNVWATWCPPCRDEMPGLQRLHADLSGQGLALLGVSIDRRSARDEMTEFLEETGVTFRILHDPDARVGRVFRTAGVPETFLIDRDGVLLRRWIGQIDPASPSVRGAVEDALHRRPRG